MGGKSKSSSSQSTSAKTTNTNQQGNSAPISIPSVDIKGGKYTRANVNLRVNQRENYTMTDYGAIEAAADSVNKSIELSNNALDYYDKINERSLEEVAEANKAAGGAVNKSIELSNNALDYYDKINERSLEEIAGVNDGVLSFADQAIGRVAEANEKALSFIGQEMDSEDSQNYQQLVKWAVVGVAVVAAAQAMKR